MERAAANGRTGEDGTGALGTLGEPEFLTQWARGELTRVAALLGEGWCVWYVATPYDRVSPFAWSAMPRGARAATCSA